MAQWCKASADSLRLQVLRVLSRDSFGVMELCSIFDIRQPALSHHLKVLANAGLVTTRREGNSIFYQRSELGQHPALEPVQQQLFASLDQIELPSAVHERLVALHQQREESSRSFFRDNADKFVAQQDLIASYEQYAETVAEGLRKAPLKRSELALEVGPGDGRFLLELAPRFERVVAVDTAAEMLEQARQRITDAAFNNIELLQGDTRHPDLAGLKADCVIINMVLHHTPQPAEVIADVAKLLADHGVVVITDLCRHDQAWAREACGDVWLGFEPEDITRWAQDAGLSDIASVYLAQRNGFQIQVRLFGHPHTTSKD